MPMQNGTSLRGTIDEAGFGAVGDDTKVWAEFRMHAVVDGVASKEAGRMIRRDVPYIKIIQPGESRLSIYDQPATDADVMRFPRQWAQFKAGQEQGVTGTPLSELFPESPAIVDNLKTISIRTVEQLAECNDSAIQNIGMGGRAWVDKARAYIAHADKGKGFHELAARLESLELKGREKDDRIAALEAALAEASANRDKSGKRNAA